MTSPRSIRLLGIRVDALRRTELLQRVREVLRARSRACVFYVNIHCMNVSLRNMAYQRILNRADVVYCDGAGVRWGARLLGKHLPERSTGADWIHDLCRLCVAEGTSLFFLAGEPGVARRARERLCRHYPGLRVVGTHHGFVAKEETPALIQAINDARPEILLVGMGTPIQEFWIAEHFDELRAPVVWAVGALMDFVSGKSARAPRWMLNHGLEWLYRLLREPRRLGRRYLVGNVTFMLRVLWEKSRLGGRGVAH